MTPATYVQMACDLANRGTVIPEFPLLHPDSYRSGVSWDALDHARISHRARNRHRRAELCVRVSAAVCVRVSLVWGRGFGLGDALYGASLLATTFALGNELWRDLPPARRFMSSALAVLLLATPKQIQLALVPGRTCPRSRFVCWRCGARAAG